MFVSVKWLWFPQQAHLHMSVEGSHSSQSKGRDSRQGQNARDRRVKSQYYGKITNPLFSDFTTPGFSGVL